MNNDNLVKYIKTAYYLETEKFELEEKIYIQETFLQKLSDTITLNNKQIHSVRESYVTKPQKSEQQDKLEFSIKYNKTTKRDHLIFIILICLGIIGSFKLMDAFDGFFVMIIGIILIILCIIKYKKCNDNILSYSEKLGILQNNYKREIEKYNQEISTLDQRKSTSISNLEEKNKKITYMISETKNINDQLKSLLNEKKKNLSYYYEGIIHNNYQDLFSVSYFYDYLDTGRCETLKECMNKLDDDIFHEKVNKNLHAIMGAIDRNTVAVTNVEKALQTINSNIVDAASDISKILSDIDLNNFEYHNKSLREQAETKKYVKNMNDIQHYRALVSGEILPTRW